MTPCSVQRCVYSGYWRRWTKSVVRAMCRRRLMVRMWVVRQLRRGQDGRRWDCRVQWTCRITLRQLWGTRLHRRPLIILHRRQRHCLMLHRWLVRRVRCSLCEEQLLHMFCIVCQCQVIEMMVAWLDDLKLDDCNN